MNFSITGKTILITDMPKSKTGFNKGIICSNAFPMNCPKITITGCICFSISEIIGVIFDNAGAIALNISKPITSTIAFVLPIATSNVSALIAACSNAVFVPVNFLVKSPIIEVLSSNALPATTFSEPNILAIKASSFITGFNNSKRS